MFVSEKQRNILLAFLTKEAEGIPEAFSNDEGKEGQN
jgi:hypothetical protein